MPRVKRGQIHLKKRKKLLSATKGFRWGRKKTIKLARPAMLKAGAYAYRDRRTKKRTFRALWLIQINAACRENGTTYSKFIKNLKDAKIEVDRKVLSQIAQKQPAVFASIVKQAVAAK